MSTIKKIGAALTLAASLGACTTPAVIADINDSAVRVQGNPYWTEKTAYEAEAARGCGLYNKQPVPLSETRGPYNSYKQVLFACK
jgi:hypothetical protein